MQEDSEETVATLIHPDEYAHHFNQIAKLTTKNIIFLKRKFVSKSGWELISFPIRDCVSIIHKDERPIFTIISGVMLILLIGFIAFMIYLGSIEPGTRIKIGLLGLAVICGFRWAFGSRRHKIIINLKDNTELIWKSRSGDYKYKIASTKNVTDFAKSVGLLRTSP